MADIRIPEGKIGFDELDGAEQALDLTVVALKTRGARLEFRGQTRKWRSFQSYHKTQSEKHPITIRKEHRCSNSVGHHGN